MRWELRHTLLVTGTTLLGLVLIAFPSGCRGQAAAAPPTITTQPHSACVYVGYPVSFTVAAAGGRLTYQWYKGKTPLPGATEATYALKSPATTDIGSYCVVVSNEAGSTTSDTAALQVASALGVWATYEQTGGSERLTDGVWTAALQNQSGVWVTDGGTLTLVNPTITTSGQSSSNDLSSFYGLNSGVLASVGTIAITGGKVVTSGTGANGVFACGTGARVTLSGTTIEAAARGGHAVMATRGGVLTLTDVNMTTYGMNGAPIATDRGGGTIKVTGGVVKSAGQDSPGVYSTGTITVEGADITATGAEGAVIEGANSIHLANTKLSGARKCGVMIYQSMSGDARGARGVYTMTGGSLTAAVGPLFYVTNTTGIIELNKTAVSAVSGVLLQAGAGRWGRQGYNGGNAFLTAHGETLSGNLVSDAASTITANLLEGTTLTGAANCAAITLDAASTWNVTADSYVTTLQTPATSGTTVSNIHGNGHTVYYRPDLNPALSGKTYTLAGGGTLQPQR